jgi:hypothetical protein
MVAEAVLGPEHSLHSKAASVLALLLQEDLLTPQEFGGGAAATAADKAAAGGKAAAAKAPKGELCVVVSLCRVNELCAVAGYSDSVAAGQHTPTSFAAIPSPMPPPHAPLLCRCAVLLTGLSAEALRLRCAAVALVALERLLQHTRRGSGTDVLWEVLLEVSDRRLAAAEAAAAAAEPTAAAATPAAATGGSGGSKSRPRTRRQQQQQEEQQQQQDPEPADQPQQQQQEQQQEQEQQQVVLTTAACGVLFLAQAVHYFRGSRVEDYSPLIKTADRLVSLLQLLPPAAAAAAALAEQEQEQELLQLQWRHSHEGQITWSVADLNGLTLSHTTLQLILGIVLGHGKEVGASQGLGFIKGPCGRWARVLGLPAVPQQELIGFTQGLVMPPSSAVFCELFAPQLLGALGKLLLAAVADSSSNGSNAAAADRALAGLLEVCSLLQPDAAFGSGSLPLLLTAHPGGADLAAAVAAMAAGCGSSVAAVGSSGSDAGGGGGCRQQLLQGWAALQLLPHAAVQLTQAVEVCGSVLAATTAAIRSLQAAAGSSGSSGSSVSIQELLQLRGMVLQMLAVLLPSVDPLQLPQLASDVLQWLLEQQQQQQQQLDFATVSSAAQVFEALRAKVDDPAGFSSSSSSTETAAAAAAALAAARELLVVGRLPDVIRVLLPSLVAPRQELRAAALRLLCCFDQPVFGSSSSASASLQQDDSQQQQQQQGAKPAHERAVFEGMRCDVLPVLRDMHTLPCSIQAGRTWSVALDRMTNHLEYGRVPRLVLPALVGGLLGVLHIRWVVLVVLVLVLVVWSW